MTVFFQAAFLATLLLAGPALAAEAKLLAAHGDWEAYVFSEKRGKVCYMASLPKKRDGGPKGRGETFVTVTHRPGEKSTDVVSVTAGYAYKKDSAAELDIDGAAEKLFTAGDGAWASDAKTDKALVGAMIRGRVMTVRGIPAKGAASADTYSLSGFTAAHDEIGKACGVK